MPARFCTWWPYSCANVFSMIARAYIGFDWEYRRSTANGR